MKWRVGLLTPSGTVQRSEYERCSYLFPSCLYLDGLSGPARDPPYKADCSAHQCSSPKYFWSSPGPMEEFIFLAPGDWLGEVIGLVQADELWAEVMCITSVTITCQDETLQSSLFSLARPLATFSPWMIVGSSALHLTCNDYVTWRGNDLF